MDEQEDVAAVIVGPGNSPTRFAVYCSVCARTSEQMEEVLAEALAASHIAAHSG